MIKLLSFTISKKTKTKTGMKEKQRSNVKDGRRKRKVNNTVIMTFDITKKKKMMPN